MTEFLQAVVSFPFLQNASAGRGLASLAFGITGTYVVVKRIGFIGGGIAHTVLGGMGVAYYLGADPMAGALVAAVISAGIISIVRLRARQHEDTLIGAMWAVGMAIGLIFLAKTPGYSVDLTSFLFGNILMVTPRDLALIAGMDLVIVLLVGLFYRPLLAVVFDEEYARLRGVPVEVMYFLLLCLVSLTVVVLIRIVGLLLVIALLTLPAAMRGTVYPADGSDDGLGLSVGLGLYHRWLGPFLWSRSARRSHHSSASWSGLCGLFGWEVLAEPKAPGPV